MPNQPASTWTSYPVDRGRLRILGCLRPQPGPAAQLRWASDHVAQFPASGFWVYRDDVPLPGNPFLPPDTSSWQAFEADVAARQPSGVTWFPSVTQADLGWLMDPVRLCDPRTPQSDVPGLVQKAAVQLDEPHRDDPNLAAAIWGTGTAPPLGTLMATPSYAALLTDFYRQQAMGFLWMLALRPAYAAVLGLYAEDSAKSPASAYSVVAELDPGGWHRDAERPAACSPPAPANLQLWRADGVTQHPEFSQWAGWLPSAALALPPADGTPAPASAYVPKYTTKASALAWDEPPPTLSGGGGGLTSSHVAGPGVGSAGTGSGAWLIDYAAYLYEVERFEHGAGTATQQAEPAFPAGPFTSTHPGSQVLKKAHSADGKGSGPGGIYADHLDMRATEYPELEGWVAYRVFGVDLFENRSSASADGQIRHFDDIAPPAPVRVGRGVQLSESGTSYVLPAAATAIDLDVDVTWDNRTDLFAPDAKEFRVYAGWKLSRYWECEVTAVQKLDDLRSRLTISGGITGFAADELKGLRITLGTWDYWIKANTAGANGYLETTNREGAPPPAGRGLVLYFDELGQTLTGLVDTVPKPVRLPATVASSAPAGNEHEFTLTPATGVSLAGFSTGVLYVHALRRGIRVKSLAAGKARVEPPTGAASEWWTEWRSLANPDAAVAGSPAILYRDGVDTVSVPKHAQFETLAKLELAVSAVDDAGNESSQVPLPPLMLISDQPPDAPEVPPWDSNKVLWARPAFDYREEARFEVTWTGQAGMRYQVGRALDAALTVRDQGAFPANAVVRELDASSWTDAQIRTLAVAAANQDLFVPIGPPAVIGSSYDDQSIPGKGQARAVYRVRAIDEANRPGPWSDVIGPVHIPVITPPAAPSIRDVIAENGDELTVRWSQTGADADTVFEVYRTDDAASASDRRLMTSVATLDANVAALRVDGNGAFAWVDSSPTPGRMYHYRVRALRRVPDPADDTGATTRDIASAASEAIGGQAYAGGPLSPPTFSAATWAAATGKVSLSWVNNDGYERISVLYRELGRAGWRPLTADVGGTASQADGELDTGKRYEILLRAFGIGRSADSDAELVET
jgi:hypothetical protein